jgi:hypothetical protein
MYREKPQLYMQDPSRAIVLCEEVRIINEKKNLFFPFQLRGMFVFSLLINPHSWS